MNHTCSRCGETISRSPGSAPSPGHCAKGPALRTPVSIRRNGDRWFATVHLKYGGRAETGPFESRDAAYEAGRTKACGYDPHELRS